ncbi:family 43 glycosylhydrolase [Flagellimonas sp. 389]|uniref:MGH1-like glycoside hydrolase domain-containing protein n=1 Tax=Flagellimonas sp. 389 TaxID=2835862 RepID=UPI001BD1C5E1|nr:family 43 glycosylhydrolase [Flagellimonas sp. 389]MBS9462894.1 family 43 glycosylhydrolase [Flagellimonas sp. 389]
MTINKNMALKPVLFLTVLSLFFGCKEEKKNQNEQKTLAEFSQMNPDTFKEYIEKFNTEDGYAMKSYVKNDKAWAWLRGQIPLFECPDKTIENTYYFRWWTLRKHIKKTKESFVMTEFLPDVPWSGPANTIVCPVGHQFNEFRWFHETSYMDDYSNFWFEKGEVNRYSNWILDAIYQRYLVTKDKELLVALLPKMVKFYESFEEKYMTAQGLFWSIDNQEGMEFSISGVPDEVKKNNLKHSQVYKAGLAHKGFRVATNSYMYANAKALSKIAALAGDEDLESIYSNKARQLRTLIDGTLWDDIHGFYKSSINQTDNPSLSEVKELSGYIPWYFNIPSGGKEKAWSELMDSNGFYSPHGLTTAEQSHPNFMYDNGHMCFWNGPSWPFATTQTLVSMANLLNNYEQKIISREDYLQVLQDYAKSHKIMMEDGSEVDWIGESIDPKTGEWISRKIMYEKNRDDKDRGVHYNHSGYVDLIVTGLVGLRPRADEILEVNPLVPEDKWDYFRMDNILYQGRNVAIVYDKTGEKYNLGKGLMVFVDGKKLGFSEQLAKIEVDLPALSGTYEETDAGWEKYDNNPVLGGDLGTCFDVSLLKERDQFKMWFSWRPEKSIALTESIDGKNWNEPFISLNENSNTDWEEHVNRPVVIKKDNAYEMWYTGQRMGEDKTSKIGMARSTDGKVFEKVQPEPVIHPDVPWEKNAIMCPHVIWDESSGSYKMWYSGGEQYEPDAIGYATSEDGINWKKHPDNPIFQSDKNNAWEYEKVTACQVVKHNGWYYMFYIGFHDVHWAQIGVARSKDGISEWERHPQNPIIKTSKKGWDRDACYKPYVIFDEENNQWMLWYNGRKLSKEQIGLAVHKGEDLGFD